MPTYNFTLQSPIFAEDHGENWLIGFQKNRNNLVVENATINAIVRIFKCESSTIEVKGKVNSVILDSCRDISIVVHDLVSAFQCNYCQLILVDVQGKVPNVSMKNTDTSRIYLNNESLDAVLISPNSEGNKVMVPHGDTYIEYVIPQNFASAIPVDCYKLDQ